MKVSFGGWRRGRQNGNKERKENETRSAIYFIFIEGDLSFHVKRKEKAGGERFPEKVIINWFI